MVKRFLQYNFSVQIILITTLLSNIGIFMVIPFLAVYLSGLKTINTAEAGLIIGIAFWCQRAGSLLGGLLSDYFDIKKTMALGLAIRIPGYAAVGLVSDFYLLSLACALIGLGSSIYLPAAKAFLVKAAPEAERVAILSMRMIFSNIGVAIGPLIGAAVFKLSPFILFCSAGLIFAVLLGLNARLPCGKGESDAPPPPVLADFYRLLMHKATWTLSGFMFVFTALYIQLESTIPLFVNRVFDAKTVSYVFICNALIVIFLQMPLSQWICEDNKGRPLWLGFLLFGGSFLLLGHLHQLYALLFAAIALFSLAEIIIQIRLDYETTYIDAKMIATAFGVMSLASAFGGLLGSALGSFFYGGLLSLSLWALLSIAAFLPALAYYIFRFAKQDKKP